MKHSFSIQQRVTLLVGGTFVALALMIGVAIYRSGRSAALTAAIEGVDRTSRELSNVLRATVSAYTDSAAQTASSAEVMAFLASPSAATETTLRQRLGRLAAGSPTLRVVELHTADGRLLFSTTDTIPPLAEPRVRELIGLIESPSLVAVGPLAQARDGASYEIVAVIKRPGNIRLGSAAYLVERRHTSLALAERARALIGGRAQLLIGNVRGDGWSDFGHSLDAAPPITPAKDTGFIWYTTKRSGRTLARATRIATTPWLFVVEYPADVIYGRVDRALGELAFTVVILLFVTFFAAWRIGQTLTRPLHELAKAAEAISAGDLSRRVSSVGDDEFGTVSSAFNRMADTLATTRNELNVRLMQLTQSESHYRALFDANPHAMWVYDVETLAFLAVNEATVRRYGYSMDEMLHMTIADMHPESGREAFLPHLANVRGNERYSHTARHMRKDGSEFDAEVTAQPLHFEGRRARIVLSTDISDRQQIEESLRLAQERLQRVVASVGAVIYELEVSNSDIRPRWISDALLPTLGYPPASAYEEGWWYNCLHPADRARFGQRTLFDRLHEGAIEYRFQHSDGTYRWIRDEQRVLRDKTGTPTSVIGALIDVTTNHQLQEQLLQSQKVEAVGRLAGGVAHDFNNLLTVILGECALVLNEPQSQDPTVKPSIEAIQKAAERATLLTRQLLTFARKNLTEPVSLSINDVVNDTSAMLNRLLGEDIRVKLSLDPVLGETLGDRGQMEQVLVNLSVNARDAMPQGGVLVIETSSFEVDENYAAPRPNLHPGSYVLLKVSDTGSGLSADAQEHLFEPFFTTKERGKGTGLGLATCYSIVRQCDGHIEIQSEEDVGTTVRIYLPAAERVMHHGTPTEKIAAFIGEETILLVEDEDVVRRVTARMLESLGYTVLQAEDGPTALALLDDYSGEIDLLMSDVVMPRMGGRELAEHVVKARPNISVLFASGYSDDVILNRQLLERDVVLLQKPFTTAALSAKIREALDRRMSQA